MACSRFKVTTPGFYDEEKLALLQGLADHCGGALERIQARTDLQKSLEALENRVTERTAELTRVNGLLEKGRDELEKVVEERTAKLTSAVSALEQEINVRREAEARSAAFSRLGGQLSAAGDFAAAGQVVLDVADQLLGWDAAYLHLYTARLSLHHPRPVLRRGRRQAHPGLLDLSRNLAARQTHHRARGRIGFRPALRHAGRRSCPSACGRVPPASRLFVPIHSRGRIIGAMSTQSYTPNAYTPDNLALLQSLADFCGGSLERVQAEQLLRQSEERFSKVFRSSPAPMSLSTLEQGIYLDVNDSLTTMLGFTREEMIGRTSIELGIWPDQKTASAWPSTSWPRNPLRNFECLMRTKAGPLRTTLASVERMDFRGEQNVLLATFHDITEWRSWRRNCVNHKKWRPSASSPPASPTISTTSSPSSRATSASSSMSRA